MTVILIGLVVGTLLASWNVYVLIPASAVTVGIVLLNGLATGKGAIWYLLATFSTTGLLEAGYLAASAALIALAGTRDPRADPLQAGFQPRLTGACAPPEIAP